MIAPDWTQPKCQSVVDEIYKYKYKYINKACCIHRVENYSNEHECTSATHDMDESYKQNV